MAVTYDVTANVAAACSISTGQTLAFGTLTDASLGNAAVVTNVVTDSAAYCNQASTTMTVSHTNITTGGTPAVGSGFTNQVNYTPVVTINGNSYGDVVGQLVGTFSSLIVKATTPVGVNGTKLVAGSYANGAITITLAPMS